MLSCTRIARWMASSMLLFACLNPAHAQDSYPQTALNSAPRQNFTPTPATTRGYWNIDVVGDFTLPRTKSITFCGAGRNLHVSQDWSKLFRRGFSAIESSRMTVDEKRTPSDPKPAGWRSRLTPDQRALIIYQDYMFTQPFNIPWTKNGDLARFTYFEQPSGSATPQQDLQSAMAELNGGCTNFGDCAPSGNRSTYGKIFFDLENEGVSFENRQDQANLYAYKLWVLRQAVSPYTEIGGIGPVPHNSHGYSRTVDYAVTAPDWLWTMQAQHIDATNTRGRGMPDALVGKSFGEQVDFAMPGTYFLSGDFDYNAPHNGDEDRHWLASLLGEQEVNRKLTNKKHIAWQWLFNTQSTMVGQAERAEFPAPPAIAEGLGIFYWFTGADGSLFWDDWDALTPNAPPFPGREGLDNNRHYACYEHYLHGLWRLFKHHGDMFTGGEQYLNEQTECSYDGGKTWYRLNANALKRSGFPMARAVVKDNQILIAATQPYAPADKQTSVQVRYVQNGYRFYTTINLKGDEIYLGRATMPTGNGPYIASATTLPVATPSPGGGGSGDLAATVVSYNCQTGAIVFGKTGGNGSTAEYMSVGITGWTTNPNVQIGAGLRSDPKTITVNVRQNGVEGAPIVFDMKGYCTGNVPLPTPTPPVTTPPPTPTPPPTNPPTGGAFSATVVSYNCQTGAIVFGRNGGSSTATTEYMSVGITGWTTNGNILIDAGLRSDPKTITVNVRQNGVEGTPFLFDMKGYCNGTPTPPVTTPPVTTPPPTTPPPTDPPTNGALSATVVSYNCQTGAITFGKTGGTSASAEYMAIGITGWTTNSTFVLDAGLRLDPKTITVYVRQNGVQGTSYTFDMKGYCSGTTPAPTPPPVTTPPVVTPPAPTPPGPCGSPANTIGQPLQVTGVKDVNCQNGSFRVVTTGGNGSGINYANLVGLSNNDPANCQRTLDNSDLVRAVNNPASDIGIFQIRVAQNGTTSNTFSFNFKQHCTGSARVAREALAELTVTVLGNPTLENWVDVTVENLLNESVNLRVVEGTGRVLGQQSVAPSGNTVRQRVNLNGAGGMLLLQVSTPTRSKTVKLLKQ